METKSTNPVDFMQVNAVCSRIVHPPIDRDLEAETSSRNCRGIKLNTRAKNEPNFPSFFAQKITLLKCCGAWILWDKLTAFVLFSADRHKQSEQSRCPSTVSEVHKIEPADLVVFQVYSDLEQPRDNQKYGTHRAAVSWNNLMQRRKIARMSQKRVFLSTEKYDFFCQLRINFIDFTFFYIYFF